MAGVGAGEIKEIRSVLAIGKETYTVRISAGERIFVNEKEVDVTSLLTSQEENVYEEAKKAVEAKDPDGEKIARLLVALDVFYDLINFPHLNDNKLVMGVIDGIVIRLATGKPCAAKYVVEDGAIRIDGGKESVKLPADDETTTNLSLCELIGKLTEPKPAARRSKYKITGKSG